MEQNRGRLLYLPEIMERTGMPDGTVRSRFHTGTMPCLWKLGRRLVVWEDDLADWLEAQRRTSRKDRQEMTLSHADESFTVSIGEEQVVYLGPEHTYATRRAAEQVAELVYRKLTGVRA